jgi:hypothetical protein
MNNCQKNDILNCHIIIHVNKLTVDKYIYGQESHKTNNSGVQDG